MLEHKIDKNKFAMWKQTGRLYYVKDNGLCFFYFRNHLEHQE